MKSKTVRMTIKEYAKKRDCSPQYVQHLIHNGKLKFEKYGRTYVILANQN